MKTKTTLIQTCLLAASLFVVASSSAQTVTQISGGEDYSLFAKSDGSLWAMGTDIYGPMGTGNMYITNRPERVVASGVTAVAAGADHSLFLTTGGGLWSMGYNAQGQLGNGTHDERWVPGQVLSSGVTAIAAGRYHSLFIKSDGSLWGMGDDSAGELGDGAINYQGVSTPEMIVASGVKAVAAGSGFSLFLKTDGSLWGMGDNYYGELGVTNSFYYDGGVPTPVQIVASNVMAIAAGYNFSLFVLNDGSLWGMGLHSDGELGDGYYLGGSATGIDQPAEIVSSGVTAVAGGYKHSVFLKSDGTAWSMGDGSYGALGDAHWSGTNVPVQMLISNVTAIAAGYNFSLLITSDGSLWATGNNPDGQLGDGTLSDTNIPELIVAGIATPTNAIPNTYNATNDFSATKGNPNGAWSYGTMPVGFGAFTLYDLTGTNGFYVYWSSAGGAQAIWQNVGPDTSTTPSGWLALHPGSGTEPSVLRWTAPKAGTVNVQAQFLPGDIGTMLVGMLLNTHLVWNATDSGSFQMQTNVQTGDTIDFAVYGGYYYGTTPVSAIVSYVQPPPGPGIITNTRYVFTTLNFPGAAGTEALGISGNNIVGTYTDGNGVLHGFVFNGSTYTRLDAPNSTANMVYGISGNNIVGIWSDYGGYHRGFLYDGSSFTTIEVPGSWGCYPTGIGGNDIVGFYGNPAGGALGFLYDGSSYTTLNVPGSTGTWAYGVSGTNIVGYYYDGSNTHGFIYNGVSYSTLDVPGAGATQILSISGTIMGGIYDTNGFIYDGTNFTIVNVPGANETQVDGISGNQIVGTYYDSSWTAHGFVATPLVPALLANNVTANQLQLSWPAGQGWILQMQTNSLSAGLGTNWVDVPGSDAISSTNIPINPASPAVYYRLKN